LRRFADFWIKITQYDEALPFVERLCKLGYTAACVETEMQGVEWQALTQKASEVNLALVRKKVVEAKRRMDVLEACRRKPPKSILTVRPLSREAFMTACRDERVDTVYVDVHNVEIDRHVIQVLKNFLEITLDDFLRYMMDKEMFKRLVTTLQVIKKKRIRCIISSGASNPLMLRSPRQLASIPEIIETQTENSLDMVSKNPFTILTGGGYLD